MWTVPNKYEKDVKSHRLMHIRTMKYIFFTHHIGKNISLKDILCWHRCKEMFY